MAPQPLRRAVVAGSWYPGTSAALSAAVDRYVAGVTAVPRGKVTGLIAPHAGLMYSGPVAAYAYCAAAGGQYDLAVLIGPSHHVGFEGAAVFARGAFDTPLGPVEVADAHASAILRETTGALELPAAHAREHCLEIQLPFLARLLPSTPIVPIVMGYQTRETIGALADGLGRALAGQHVLFVASSDLSHYRDERTARQLDGEVMEAVAEFDDDSLLRLLERYPEHACGGGPMVAVMRASRRQGASEARVLKYADSGDVSGDKSAVVGYMAAAFGTFEQPAGARG